jgi:hypothetical protein
MRSPPSKSSSTDVCMAIFESAGGSVVGGRAVDLVSVQGDRPIALSRLRGDAAAVSSSRVLRRRTRTAG